MRDRKNVHQLCARLHGKDETSMYLLSLNCHMRITETDPKLCPSVPFTDKTTDALEVCYWGSLK